MNRKNWHFILAGWVILVAVLDVVTSAKRLPLGVKFFTMDSGSMSPSVPVNSLVITKPSSSYKVGEVITFKFPGTKETVTHRVVNYYAKDNLEYFITKGDQNETVDRRLIPFNNVFGKVVGVIPYLGWFIKAIETQLGLIVLVAIPATLVVRKEIIVIGKEAFKY